MKPKNIPGECNKLLAIGDDYGDNQATMRCQLKSNHMGMHQEIYSSGKIIIQWDDSVCEQENLYEDEEI